MEINIGDLTTKDLLGTGVFDNIMEAMQVRLDREFAKNRLKGPEYAKVYLGSIEASLMNSIQFLLGRQQADKQAEKTAKETLLLDEQIAIAKIEQQLKWKQLELAELEILLKAQELLIRKEELEIKKQELLIAIAKLELTKVQVWTEKAKVSNDITITDPPIILTGLMGGQIRKIDIEGTLLSQKVITEKAQTCGSTVDNPVAIAMQIAARNPIAIAEYVEFRKWARKPISTRGFFDSDFGGDWCTEFPELCNIWGIIDPDNPPDWYIPLPDPTVPVDPTVPIPDPDTPPDSVPLPPMPIGCIPISGILGRQMDLYKKQTDGFDRDAEQKLAKIYTDTMNTLIVATDTADPGTAGLNNDAIKSVLAIAKTGITPPSP